MKNIYLFLLLGFITYSTKAQWTNNKSVNTLVSTEISTTGNSFDPQPFHRSDNKTWIVYPGDPDHRSVVRVQLLDEYGYRLFGDSGMAISNGPDATYQDGIAYMDSANNLYVPFVYDDNGLAGCAVQKISPDGNLLWGNGVELGRGNTASCALLTTGELIVAWFGLPDIYYQKISTNGVAEWTTAKIITAEDWVELPQVVAGMNGRFSIVYEKDTISYYRHLMFLSFNNDGKPYFSPLKISSLETFINGYASIVTNRDTVYVGYYGEVKPTKQRTDAFIQKINPGGVLPWGENGVAFADYSTDQEIVEKKVYIAKQNLQPQRIWAICTIKGPGDAMSGISAQLLDFNGNRLFGNYGKVIFPISTTNWQLTYSAPLVNNGRLLFLMNTPFDYSLHISEIDANGFTWPDSVRTVCSTTNSKRTGSLVRLGNSKCIATWIEDKDHTTQKVYAQAMNMNPGSSSVNQTEIISIKNLYPNPAANNLSTTINSSTQTKVHIYITDVSGNTLKQAEQNLLKGDNIIHINVSTIKPGSYFIKVMNENVSTATMFNKQ